MNTNLEEITRNLIALQSEEVTTLRDRHIKRLHVPESFEAINNYFNLTGELIRDYTHELMKYLTEQAEETINGRETGEDGAQ